MLGSQKFSVINANPTLTTTAEGGNRLKPRSDTTARINRQAPDLVILCGRLAEAAVDTTKLGPTVACYAMKHPAFRLFSREMERQEAGRIESLLNHGK